MIYIANVGGGGGNVATAVGAHIRGDGDGGGLAVVVMTGNVVTEAEWVTAATVTLKEMSLW